MERVGVVENRGEAGHTRLGAVLLLDVRDEAVGRGEAPATNPGVRGGSRIPCIEQAAAGKRREHGRSGQERSRAAHHRKLFWNETPAIQYFSSLSGSKGVCR